MGQCERAWIVISVAFACASVPVIAYCSGAKRNCPERCVSITTRTAHNEAR